MEFMKWFIESQQEEEQKEREAAYEKSASAYYALAKKYNFKLADLWIQNNKRHFMTAPIEEIRQEMQNFDKQMKDQDQHFARQARDKEEEARKEALRDKSPGGDYDAAESSYERIVCSSGSPEYEKIGMKAYPMKSINKELDGYYGVHVGGGWLGILKRDGYCDSGDAYEYTIHCEEMIEDGIDVWIMEDPHVSYRDASTPDSWIIFSKEKVIPAKYIELNGVTKEEDIEEARPPYGME